MVLKEADVHSYFHIIMLQLDLIKLSVQRNFRPMNLKFQSDFEKHISSSNLSLAQANYQVHDIFMRSTKRQ